jgi:hypothetical protein
MTKKIKFITRLLVLTLFSTFISCNDELYDIKYQHNGIDKNKISLTQFKNETNIDQVEPILSVHTKTSIASKSKSQLSDFVIDTLAIKRHISTDNKTTYTFRIYPLSSVAQTNDIYNLVYRKVNNNWETSIFYLKKLPKENSEHKLFEKIERIYGGKITNAITSKSSSLEMCSYETISIHCDGNSTCTSNGSCDGFACPTGQCIQRSVTYMSCSSGGGGGGGSSDPGGTYSSGGGSSDPYSYSPNTYDNPVYDDPNYINAVKRSYVWYNLGDAAQGFFASNQENMNYFNQTIQYQIDNNWSPESKVLMDFARNFKKDNPDATLEDAKDLFLYKVIIDPSFKNNPCLYGVYKQLGQAPTFQNYLQKFDGDFSVADLKLSVGVDPNKPKASAVTYEPINSLIEIKFNPNFLNSPPLNIARNFIHEMLHAEMYRKLLSLSKAGSIPWSTSFIESIKDDYPGIADYYLSYEFKVPVGQEPTSAQHQLMAQHSRGIIIELLRQYDNTQTEEVYEALAWIGLMGSGEPDKITGLPPKPTVAWENTPQAERLKILKIYQTFIKTNTPCQ